MTQNVRDKYAVHGDLLKSLLDNTNDCDHVRTYILNSRDMKMVTKGLK